MVPENECLVWLIKMMSSAAPLNECLVLFLNMNV